MEYHLYALLKFVIFFFVHLCVKVQSSPVDQSGFTSYVVVQTKLGQVRGLVVNASSSDSTQTTSRFLGLPYALPPTGPRRFRKPDKHPGWPFSGILNATEHKPSCPQNSDSASNFVKPTSEDCLYLNVFVPGNLSAAPYVYSLSYPVMVYIHGGDFKTGSAGEHDVSRLATHGEVIVVDIQYRLGALGFLSLLNEHTPGNVGLWDQRLALHWIWDNVHEFGGDPERITIFGEGAGGVSVGHHVLSAHNRGLFIRAISQDGTALCPQYLQHQPTVMATALAQLNNCSFDSDSELVDCLQELPVESLMHFDSFLEKDFGGWLPVVDGDFISGDPNDVMSRGQYNWVDYVIGVNSHIGYDIQKTSPLDFKKGISFDDLKFEVEKYVWKAYTEENLKWNMNEVVSAILNEYIYCDQDEKKMAEILMEIYGDLHFTAPALRTAAHMSRSDKQVFVYSFSHHTNHSEQVPQFASAIAGDELNYIFDGGDVTSGHMSPEDRLVSSAMKDAWTNFAKVGDPNPVNDRGVNWRRYSLAATYQLDFRLPLESRSLRHHTKPRRVAFWNNYLPHVISAPRKQCTARFSDRCVSQLHSVQADQTRVSLTLWILMGVCGLMCLIIAVLVFNICVQRGCQRCCCRSCVFSGQLKPHQKLSFTDAELRSLRPLPYVDEA